MLQSQEINATYSPDSKSLTFDRNLKFSCPAFEKELSAQIATSSSEKNKDKLSQLLEPFVYPSTFEYAELAHRAYAEQNQGGKLEDRFLPDGWSLLTTAYNDDVLNSYFGAAYWNSTKRQVVIAHRGTVFKPKKEIIGTLRADIEGVVQNQPTPQVDSAVTFAYQMTKVIREINKNNPGLNIQLSFTGHSLGGWLAQITAYTTKYLEKVGNHFLKDKDFQKNGLHAHTIVFDSPGCREKLSSLQDELESRGMVHHYEHDLDITVYLSGPNLINTYNRHVGTLYRVFIDLSEEENINRALYYTRIMHKMPKIKKAVSENKISRIIDWPLLGRPSSFESKGYLEWAFEIFEYCAPYVLPEPLPTVVESVGFINQLRQYYNNTGEYRKIFEDLEMDNNFDISSDKILNSLGFARIRYQTKPVGEEDNSKCTKNVFTNDEWQFLIWYQMLCAQSNPSSIHDLLSSSVFENNENITINVTTFLNRFTINKEIIAVNEGSLDEFIAYVKHLLHLFPRLCSDELIDASNIRYQLESFLYIQSNIMDFFKNNVQQRELQAQNEHSHFEKKPIDLNSFLNDKEIKILHITQPDSLLGLNVVYDIYKDHGYGEDRYAFFSLERILALQFDNLSNFLTNKTNNGNDTHSDNTYLLVIECELDAERIFEGQDFLNRLLEWSENYHIKLILFSKKNSLSDLLGGETSVRFDNLKYAEKTLAIEFSDLNKLAKEKLLRKEVVFQGQEIALDTLITGQDEIIKGVITSEVLAELIKNEKIEIGKSVPNLGETEVYYIDRSFSHQIKITQGILSERSSDKFFIVNMAKDTLLAVTGTEQIRSVSEIKRAPHQYRDAQFILSDDAQIAKDDFKYLCDQSPNQIIHWLEKETNGGFLWHGSKGSVSLLRKYLAQSTDSLISDKEIIKNGEPDNKLIIIAAEPGMGKSTVLTYLANQQKEKDPAQWVLRVDLLKYKDKINQSLFGSIDNDLSFLYDVNGTENRLSKILLEHFIKYKGNIVLLLDGFDEIEGQEQEKVIKLIDNIKNEKIEKVFLSTRFHERERLEDKLSTFSYTFEPFTEKDQIAFLKKFWGVTLDLNEAKEVALEQYIKELLTFFSDSIHSEARTFMGIPLQIKMIAELFQSSLKNALYHGKPFEPIENFEILKLYEDFVQLKYNLYIQEKLGLNITYLNIKKKEKFTSSFIKMHQSAAMNLLFSDIDESMLATIGNKFLLINDKYELEILKLIGIFQVVNQNIEVTHRSFAEYFAAGFLNDMLQKEQSSKKYESICSFLSKEIFEPKNQVIRIFLDYYLTNRKTIYEQSLDAIEFRLPKDPDVIPSEQLVRSLYATTFNKNSLNTLNKHIGELLEKLKAKQINEKDIKYRVKRIKEDILILSEIALHNKTIRYAAMEGKVDVIKSRLSNLEIDDKDVIHDTDNLGRTALHYAVQKGNKEIVEALLTKGFKVEALDNLGKNALHYAARYNAQDTETIACLLKHASKGLIKAIINIKDKQGFTPLYYAAQQGYWHTVASLIDNGANADNVPDKKELLFHYIYKADLKPIESALKDGVDINQYRDTQKNGLLHIAAQRGDLRIVNFLLEKGIDVQMCNKYGERPIYMAARNGHWEVVTRLLFNNDKLNSAYFNDLDGAQKNSLLKYFTKDKFLTKLKFFFEDGNKDKYFNDFNLNAQEKIDLLCQFTHLGELGIVKFFISKGTEIDSLDSTGKKPIQYAAEKRRWDIVKFFLTKEGTLFDELNDQQKIGYLSHFIFIGSDELETIKVFLDKGINVDSRDEKGKTLLHRAAQCQQLDIVRYLVEDKRAWIYAKDDAGHTPLYYAAINIQDHMEVAKYLLDKGDHIDLLYELHCAVKENLKDVAEWLIEGETTTINIEDKDTLFHLHSSPKFCLGSLPKFCCKDIEEWLSEEGTTVKIRDKGKLSFLHFAMQLECKHVAEWLIEKWAKVKVEGTGKLTLLHLATLHGYEDVAALLIGKGSNVNAVTTDKWTPLHLAALHGYEGVVRLLIENGAEVNAENEAKITPLHLAAAGNYEDIVRLLIENRAEIKAKAQLYGDEATPLYMAALHGHENVVRLLIENGAEVKVEDSDKFSPLAVALAGACLINEVKVVARDYLATIKLLIENGAEVNVEIEEEEEKCNYLHMVADYGPPAVARVLIENGAKVKVEDNHKRTPLHNAARRGNLEMVKYFLEQGADIHAANDSKKTPLHEAAGGGHLEMVKYLIEQGADVHAIDQNGHRPSYNAAKEIPKYTMGNINIELVKYLLEKEADCELPYKLHYAAEQGYKEVLAALLNEEGIDVNAETMNDLLDIAIKNAHEDVAKLLIEKGAIVDTDGKDELIRLHMAILYGHEDVAKLLIENGAGINAATKNKLLSITVKNGYRDIVRLLIENGAEVNVATKNNLLEIAIKNGHEDVAKLLIEKGANVNAATKNNLLNMSIKNGHEGVAELLIENGAEVNVKALHKFFLLYVAVQKDHRGVARFLIENGAEVNITKGGDECTLLHVAAKMGHRDIAELLIEKGANVNAEAWCKNTPLHEAAEYGHEGVVKLLIEKGANVNAKGGNELTPLHLAALKGHLEMVKHLVVEQGANVKSKDNKGRTPLDLAWDKPKNQQIITFLRLAAENSYNDNSNNTSAGTFASVTFFNKGKKSDDEPQNQSHSAQQPHYSGG